MKPKLLSILLPLILWSFSSFSTNIYKHQILQSEVDELNILANAIGISGTGWPASGEEFSSYPNVSGISFLRADTVFKESVLREDNEYDYIYVIHYKVSGISFSYKNYSGELPDLSFSELEKFIITNNSITGVIPNFDFPKCKELDLSRNQLSGEIPDFNLPLLEELDLSSNNLTGELPLFTGLPNLTTLSVRSNKLTSINKDFGLPKLVTAYINSNEYSGELPSFNCPMLESLYLSNHNFSGEIPNDMNLPSCKRLELRNNQLSGSLPDLNFPSMEYLDLVENKLSGEIPIFTGMPVLEAVYLGWNDFTSIAMGFSHPTLKTFSVFDSKLSGNIPNISLPNGERIDLSGNEFSGNIPEFNCPNLTHLTLAVNNLTGNIPNFNMPKMENLRLHENNLTGSIPNFNMPELVYLDLQHNELTGTIPNFNCPKLWELELGYNNLEGELPNFNYPILEELDVTDNNLSGKIPDLNLPSLEYLELSYNNFTGELPNFNMPKLIGLNAVENNLEGSLPDFNFPELDYLNLYKNNFSGEIPSWNLPKLRMLTLYENELEGTFNNANLPTIFACNLNDNNLEGLAHLKSGSPNLYSMQVARNRLTFEDLEPNMDLNIFFYENQDSVEHIETASGNQTILSIKVGGSANQYQWMKKINNVGFNEIAGATSDSVSVPFEPNATYTCKITNSLVPDLTLYSKKGIAPSCISIGVLEFCTESSEWEKGDDKNTVTTNGKVNINDLLVFEGNITIDTTLLTLKADGEFYMSDIPLPGGSSVGKFSFCKGEYELKLAGEEGAITNFANSQLAEVGELFGIELGVTKLELVGGRNATGVKMNCEVKIPGITGACGEGGDDKTKVELSGLSFTTTNGVSLDGVKITDLGMFIEGFCLKQLEVSYDSEKDVLISGASIGLPFGEIGGGFKLAQGFLDSVAWRIEASKPAFVIGTTTIGVKGCFGRISNITDNPLEVELGGIFSDITTENLYQLDISGMTKWPSVFGAKGSGKFLKPPFVDKPYQINGEVSLEYDFSENIFKVEMSGKVGTNDEETWLIDGSGKLIVSHKTAPTKIGGNIDGTMTLTELEKKFPYTWLNSMFSLPIKGEAYSAFVWAKSRILNGQAKFQTETRGPYAMRYVINLEKAYGEPGFLYWDTNVETKSAKLKSGNTTGEYSEEIVIPENTDFAVIGITSDTLPPVSTLTDPTGKIYESTSEEDQVIYTLSADSTQAFWTVSEPIQGVWNVVLTDPSEQDSVILFVQQPLPELEISMVQDGNQVTVTWDPTYLSSSYEINIMLDDDDSGFDGFSVAHGMANTGQITFEMNDLLSACNYNLYAQVSNDNSTIQDYADGIVANPKAILSAPSIQEVNYNPTTGITTVYYENSTDFNSNGYIVEVIDNLGNDSIYSVINARGDSINLVVEDYENKAVRMTSFDLYGLQGCPSEAVGIHNTGVEEFAAIDKSADELIFYPNPTSGKGTIKYRLGRESHCDIIITDFTGRVIAQPVSQVQTAGTHREEWNFGNMPNGMYLIVLKTSDNLVTTKCILNR